MADIYLALALMLIVCVAAFAMGLAMSRRLTKRVAAGLAIADLAALVIFIKWGWDAPILAKLIPLPNVIVLGNFQPPLTALLAGALLGHDAS